MIVSASYLDLRDEENNAVDKAVTIAATVGRLAVPHLKTTHYPALQDALASIEHDPAVESVHVFEPAGRVDIDGDRTSRLAPEYKLPLVVSRAMTSGQREVNLAQGRVEIGLPILDGGRGLGVAYLVMTRPEAADVVRTIWLRNALIAIFLISGALPITFHFGNGFLKPVHHLTAIAYRVSAGDFDAPFPVQRRDEIGVLARAYSDMVRTIRGNMERIHQLAFVDSVTKLCNRECFRGELERSISAAARQKDEFAVLFIDLDRFKRVNDTYGHDVGDKLLATVARRLCDAIDCVSDPAALVASDLGEGEMRQEPLIARLGGDEFAVFLPDCRSAECAAMAAEAVVTAVADTGVVDGISIAIGASVGIALYPRDGHTYTTLLKNADIAMYAAKQAGGSGHSFYNAETDRAAVDRVRLEAELGNAVAGNELTLHYQPQVEAGSGRVVAVEALLRWNHPDRGQLGPGAFIGLAEETGQIAEIGRWVLREACRQGARWCADGRALRMAVNISIAQFRDHAGFTDMVMDVLTETGLPPSLLELEITESMAMGDPADIARIINPLRAAGIRFAIDDFGTGYSSLAHLTRLPFDIFKIDRNFTAGIGKDQSAEVIVQTILAMARSLAYDTVAEGVETREQLAFLKSHGCTMAQGYLVGRPMAAEALENWLTQGGFELVEQGVKSDYLRKVRA